MSRFSRSLNYALNPKSASLSLDSKPLPPIVELDSLLMSWGLLSGEYTNDGTIKSKTVGRINQLFILLFLFYYSMKFFIAMFIDDNSIILIYMGDWSLNFVHMIPRVFILSFWLSITLKSLTTTIYYYVNRNTGQLNWFRISQLTKGNV